MLEKLIENWLTEVNELGYQLPFCEALIASGYSVLHVSRHGRGEHGKDIVARNPAGVLYTFQLKSGDIGLSAWRDIRGEVEELVTLPVRVPGVSEDEPHQPYLVTNGEIVGDAVEGIVRSTNMWVSKGHPRLGIWKLHDLLTLFITAHGSYLPRPLVDLRRFVELYVADFTDRVPRARLSEFLTSLVDNPPDQQMVSRTKRSIESMVLLAGYIIEQYEREKNHVAAAEGWTIAAATVLRVVQRENLERKVYEPSLDLIELGLRRDLEMLVSEVLSRKYWVEPAYILAEPYVLPARVGLVLGWLAVQGLMAYDAGTRPAEMDGLPEVFQREGQHYKVTSEADWPGFVARVLYTSFAGDTASADHLLAGWVSALLASNTGDEADGLPSPYWLQEKAIALYNGQVSEYDQESFLRASYTVESALDMLVRRGRRDLVASRWPAATRLGFVDFTPDQPEDWFVWRAKRGEQSITYPPRTRSWRQWRKEVSVLGDTGIPSVFLRHPQWALPFALTFPHRLNRALTSFLDYVFTDTVRIIRVADEA